MERMRARGARGARGLTEMVRDQVKVLAESSGKMAKTVDALVKDVRALNENVGKLGVLMEAFAEASDAHDAALVGVDKRLSALEKKAGVRK